MPKSRRTRDRTGTTFLWEARNYDKGLAKEFRALPCLQVVMDIEVHRLFHRLYKPPAMADREDMEYFVQRHRRHECGCYEGEVVGVNALELGGGDGA